MRLINFVSKTGNDGQLHLNIPLKVTNATVEVTVVLNILPNKKPDYYDFTDLAGQLHWKGDALIEQRKIRND